MRISVNKLGKRYSRDWVFRDLDWQFEDGCRTAILGPNGSGKSTLLQILTGQVVSTTGTVEYSDGGSRIPAEEVFHHVAIAAPYLELTDGFTLEEAIRFHFTFKKVRGGFALSELPELFGLAHAAGKRVRDFSSGMQQRLKLGLAFYSEARLLFLDEPTTNLDDRSAEWYRARLAEVGPHTSVFIASNQAREYPETARKLQIQQYSGVTKGGTGG
jgi:ABC-type multidrug transport system ATPase subunit